MRKHSFEARFQRLDVVVIDDNCWEIMRITVFKELLEFQPKFVIWSQIFYITLALRSKRQIGQVPIEVMPSEFVSWTVKAILILLPRLYFR